MNKKRKMNYFNRIGFFLLAVMFVVVNLLPTLPVAAEEKKGSITFNFEGISDIEFRLYKVASQDGKGGFTLTDDFKEYAVDLSDTTAAETLQYYVRRDQVKPLEATSTDSNGQIFFDDLEEGVYLILADRFERGNKIYYPQPVLVSIPSKDGKNKLIWDLVVNAKYTECVKPTPPDKTTIHVQKIWDDKANPDRPESIVVQLLKGNKVHEEVTLDKNNNWSYTWKDLDVSADWSVVEKTQLKDYHVVIAKMANGTTFVIINKKPCNPPTPPEEPTTEATTQERPTTEATTEGTTQDRPTTEATTEGTTEEQPTTEATTESTTEEQPTTEATTESTTEEQTTTEATTESTTEEQPTTEERPNTQATTEFQPPESTTQPNKHGDVTPPGRGGGGGGGGGSRLPQTGQLWWPVNILLCVGMLSIIIGIKVGRKKEDKE